MRLVWLFAIATAACSNSSSGGADAARADGPHADSPPAADAPAGDLTVRARVGELVVGSTMATEAVDPIQLSVTLADGSTPQLSISPDGTISFQRASADQGYLIDTDNVPGATVIEDTAATLSYLPGVFGHSQLVYPTQPTLVDANVTPASGSGAGVGSFAILFATGQRASVALPSPYFVAVADWRDASGDDGPAGLLSTSDGDLLWFLHYTAPTAGHTLADQALSMPVDQTDGSATTLAGSAQVLATTGCVRAAGAVTEELARFGSNVPGATSRVATLGVETEPQGADTVGGGDLAVGTASVAADTSVDIPYTTPFPNERIVGAFAISATVLHAVGTKKITTTTTETVHVALGSGAYACTDPMLVQVPAGAAFASALTVGGVPIAADEQPVTLGAATTLEVDVTASAGTANRFTIQLVDLSTQAALATWVSSGSKFSIPRALFTAGDTYAFTIRIDSGLPGAATGDLTVVTYPISSTTTSSYTFTTSG